MILIYIILFIMNINVIVFIILLPLLRYLSIKRSNAKEDTRGNLSAYNTDNRQSFVQALRLYFASYHTRYAIRYIGLIPSHRIRKILYKKIYLANLGNKTVIYYGAELRSPWKLQIGEGTIIGDNVILDASRGIKIGNNVNISSRASLYSLQHDYRNLNFDCTENNSGEIILYDRVWIGPQVIILPNIKIGEGSVIAGGAVVTKDVPSFEVWGGVPAKKIGDRPKNINYTFNGFHPHFL